MSRTILERSALAHRILRSATAADPAADFERGDEQRRHRIHTANVHILLANGPLRAGPTTDDDANTYRAFGNPDTYAPLTTRRG